MTRIVVIGLVLALALVGYLLLPDTPDVPAATYELLASTGSPEFKTVQEPRAYVFPQDHGPHFDYQTEWWYYTGNLMADEGERFGFQLTIFRRGLTSGELERESDFATNQVYFGHLAVTDVDVGEHVAMERFERGAVDLAGASGEPFSVYLGNWSIESLDEAGSRVRLYASEEAIGLDLELSAVKPIVAHGEHGFSPKGDAVGNATHYLSFTDMETEGSLTIGDRIVEVSGSSWFDHEWGTSALGPEATGWDWFGLQLEDGRELMLFQIRTQDGDIERVSGGTLVEADGQSRWLTADEFTIETLSSWTSSTTDITYPSGWEIVIPDEDLELFVEPLIDDQEMKLNIQYWEGAVRVSGSVDGYGYAELTGYSGSMQGLF